MTKFGHFKIYILKQNRDENDIKKNVQNLKKKIKKDGRVAIT